MQLFLFCVYIVAISDCHGEQWAFSPKHRHQKIFMLLNVQGQADDIFELLEEQILTKPTLYGQNKTKHVPN